MKLYTESDLIELVQSLKEYTHESHAILGHDEREAKDFVDIFLKDRTPIELPSDKEIDGMELGSGMHDFYKGGFIEGAKWMKEKILNQNK